MADFQDFSLKVKNFKCFGEEEQGFDCIKSINLIVGRNNSGKSTLLDLLQVIGELYKFKYYPSDKLDDVKQSDVEVPREFWRLPNIKPEIILEVKLSEKSFSLYKAKINENRRQDDSINIGINSYLYKILFPSIHGAYYTPQNLSFFEIIEKYNGAKADVRIIPSIEAPYSARKFVLKPSLIQISEHPNIKENGLFEYIESPRKNSTEDGVVKGLFERLKGVAEYEAERAFSLLIEKIFTRIQPDRNISPEEDDINSLVVNGNGTGSTNIIQNFYNRQDLKRELVEEKILNDLNLIFKGDAQFTRIIPRRDPSDGKWEIALEEEYKGFIPLSQSGSSIKTVMILLVFIYLLPETLKNKNLSDFIFSIEELENNLHPSLLRRLLIYLYGKAKSEGCIFFLATHSNVAIDYFSNEEDAQILHVTHDGDTSVVKTVDTHIGNTAIFDDLGFRASDLLQANGIIWVEGPSDIIYIKKWLEMYCDENRCPQFKQGTHYEFQMYGGALLKSICLVDKGTLDEKEACEKLIAMFSFSRNAFVVIDSDAVEENGEIVDKSTLENTKAFFSSEIERLSLERPNLGIWFDRGNTEIPTIESYLSYQALGEVGERGSRPKKRYAQLLIESWDDSIKLEDFNPSLKDEIEKLYGKIAAWNA